MEAERLNLVRRRQTWLYVLLLLFGARLAWAFVDIQVLSHDTYLEDAQRQQKRRIEIPAKRGVIEDRNGVPLAVNREQYAIYLVPRHIADVDGFVKRFTAIVPYDERELRARVAEGGWYLRLVKGVSRETVKRLEEADIDGVGIETYQVRHYPYEELADDLLGRVDVDNVGIEGVELFYDEVLRGRPGFTVHQRDALGREYPNFTYPVEAPVDGQTVQLTIDLGLQEIVEDALASAMERTRARKGSVVVVDPRTGELLALANRSADDDDDPGPTRNYAVVDQFEPGSTFKVVTLAGLYEEGRTAPTDSLFCENGTWTWNGRTLRDVHPYGFLTVEEVIEESSNICAAKLAERLGELDLYEFSRRFGFGLPTGLDFPGEPRGLLKRPDEWTSMTTASVAMGYEVMVTSIQLAMAYAAIANGGELLRPYLVRRIVRPDGGTAFVGEPQRVRQVVRPETAAMITQALVRVVEAGTARSAQLEVLPVAGKTGTARKIGEHGYESGRYTSSFVGFFPAVEPRYVVFVRIDEPRGAFYGGAVAAPVFREAMESTVLTSTMSASPSLMERVRHPDRVVWKVSDSFVALPDTTRDSLPPPAPPQTIETRWTPLIEPPEELRSAPAWDPRTQVKVPDFSGLSLREAIQRANRLGVELSFDGVGRIASQEPEPGEIVARGAAIRVSNP
ncbi:MAG TPA: penicillin-binding protein [Gemmatimonadota bacterium]|jgi:cell division protein FtsI (penicillin-binding protein 3)